VQWQSTIFGSRNITVPLLSYSCTCTSCQRTIGREKVKNRFGPPKKNGLVRLGGMIITFFNFFNTTTYTSVRAWYCIIIMTVLVLTYCDCCSYQATSSIVIGTLHNLRPPYLQQIQTDKLGSCSQHRVYRVERTEQNRTREK
jgi:hypothetical protein